MIDFQKKNAHSQYLKKLFKDIDEQVQPLLLEAYRQQRTQQKNICLFADDEGKPRKLVPLDEVIATTGINPFMQSADLDVQSDAFRQLAQAGFLFGLQIHLNVPEDATSAYFENLTNDITPKEQKTKIIRLHRVSTQAPAAWLSQGLANSEFKGEPKTRHASASSTQAVSNSPQPLTLKHSSQVMQNYLHATAIDPQKKFQAIQTTAGHSLMFSVDCSGHLHAIQETSGQSSAGYLKHNLSEDLIQSQFKDKNARCDTFAAFQNDDHRVQLAMVISTPEQDHLYLLLNQSATDLEWLNTPQWQQVTYDCTDKPTADFDIKKLFFCQMMGKQCVMVDLVDKLSDNLSVIQRYYVQPHNKDTSEPMWQVATLAGEYQADQYQSCVGRIEYGEYTEIDGLYTMGHVSKSAQIMFTPMADIWNEPITSARLTLPDENALPDAMAAVSQCDKPFTHLFIVSDENLYYFSPEVQVAGGIPATKLLQNDLLIDTKQLFALKNPINNELTLWGVNASKKVYRLSCAMDKLAQGNEWSTVIPVLNDIEQLSPYIHTAKGHPVIFAASTDKIHKVIQNPYSGLWQENHIYLPAPRDEKAIAFDAYTSTVKMTDANGKPYINQEVKVKTSPGTSLYINGLYYHFSDHAIFICTDHKGHLTVMENMKGALHGSSFVVEIPKSSQQYSVNPMESAHHKLSQLNSAEKLKSATYQDEQGQTHNLVAQTTTSGDLEQLSASIQALNKCHDSVALSVAKQLQNTQQCVYLQSRKQGTCLKQFGIDSIEQAIGDLFNWLKSGFEAVVSLIKDTAEDIWFFVVEIGNQAYHAIIDTFEAVFEAFEWLFNTIKTGIEKIIQFIKVLFDINDIRRTKNVLHKVISLYLEDQVSGIHTLKESFNQHLDKVQADIGAWSGNEGWADDLGETAKDNPQNHAGDVFEGHTSSSLHLIHHFENHSHNVEVLNAPVKQAICEDRLDQLIQNLGASIQEGADDFNTAINNLIELVTNLPTMSMVDIVKALLGILANSALAGCQLVINVIFDIMELAAGSLLDFISAKIHIPILSDILGDFSILDVFCWVIGAAFTVVYKLANQRTPFNEAGMEQILAVNNMDQLRSVIQGDVQYSQTPRDFIGISTDEWFDFLHGVGGMCAIVNAGVSSFDADLPPGNTLGKVSAGLAVLGGGCIGIANYVIPNNPVQSEAVQTANKIVLGLRLANKGLFFALNFKEIQVGNRVDLLKNQDNRAIGAFIDALLVLPGAVCSAWHCYELSQCEDKNSQAYQIAVLEEASNFAFYAGRVAYTVAVCDPEPATKNVFLLANAASNALAGGLQIAQTGVSQPNQLAVTAPFARYALN